MPSMVYVVHYVEESESDTGMTTYYRSVVDNIFTTRKAAEDFVAASKKKYIWYKGNISEKEVCQ